MIDVGKVVAFKEPVNIPGDKATQVKLLEESAECVMAYREYEAKKSCVQLAANDFLGECADVIQCVANLIHEAGLDDMWAARDYMTTCRKHNEERNREYEEEQ